MSSVRRVQSPSAWLVTTKATVNWATPPPRTSTDDEPRRRSSWTSSMPVLWWSGSVICSTRLGDSWVGFGIAAASVAVGVVVAGGLGFVYAGT